MLKFAKKTAFSLVKRRLTLGLPTCLVVVTMPEIAYSTGKCLLTAPS